MLLGTPGQPNSLPPDVSGLYVNEILASNTTALPDEQGEFDDWFELYNASDDSLNVGGLCFTDDTGEPFRWQLPLHFPEQTTLPPHGFLLLWADGQPKQGLLHADFKLSAGGETVAVFQREGSGYVEREHLDFGPQNPDISWGRYPDGSTDTRTMPPTPAATNMTSDTGETHVQPLKTYPSPFKHRLYVDAENVNKPYSLVVRNMLGQAVYEAGGLREVRAVIPRNGLPPGLYTVALLDAMGRRYVGKVAAE